jgi:predicted nucleic acid-binding protein
MILECALLAKAQIIVSGDKDLFSLRQYGSARITTARQYLDGGLII